MRKILSIFLCLAMLIGYIPTGLAEEGPVSSNADLSSLTVAGSVYYDLTPAFNAGTTAYAVDVPNDVSSVEITATAADTAATLEINGAAATSGAPQTVDNLSVGDNTIAVAVTAQDGTTVKTYTITIKRAGAGELPQPPAAFAISQAAVDGLPQTPAEYAASDYAKYTARMAVGEAHIAVINANGAVGAGGDNSKFQREVPEALNGVKVKAVAAGTYHTLALTEDGRVFAWGQIAQSGSYNPISIPVEVENVQGNIKLIAAGASMSAVLTNSNQLIVWGGNSTLSAVPDGLGNIVAVAINAFCVVTLNDQGNVKVWGDSNCNVVPSGLDGNVVAVATGQWHWLALKKDGTVSVTGSSVMTDVCGEIASQTNVRAIVGGWQSAGAILDDGSVKCWGRTPAGYNTDGQVQIAAGANIKALVCTVSGGLGSSPALCARQEDGAIRILAPGEFTTAPITDQFNFLTVPGDNANLSGLEVAGYTLSPAFDSSTGTYTVNVPTDVSSVNIIATTADSGAGVKIKGTAAASGTAFTVSNLAEGDNLIPVVVTAADFTTTKTYNLTVRREPLTESNNPYLSGLTVAGYSLTPAAFDKEVTAYAVTVPYEPGSVDITATTASPIAGLKINGTAAVSGAARTVDNLVVGANTVVVEATSADTTFVKTYTLTITRQKETIKLPQTPAAYAASDLARYASKMAMGYEHMAAVDAGGTMTLGGKDTYAQLSSVPAELTGVKEKAVAAGTYHTLALTEDGRVYAWGKAVDPTGDGTTYSPVTVPDEVTAVQGSIKQIAAGDTMSAVLTTTGQLIVWGYNTSGLSATHTGLNNIVAVAVNRYCVVVLDEAGDVTVWGDSACTTVPDGVNGNTVAIAAGNYHWLALKKDGTVALTGDATTVSKCNKITGLSNARAIVGGYRFAGALLVDGSVKGWGTTITGGNSNTVSGRSLIAADAYTNIRAITSIILCDTNKIGICAIQGNGMIRTVCYSGFSKDPIKDDFNFLAGAGSNADLSSLTVEGYDLDPAFAAGTTAYTVNVPNEVSSVNITATLADSGATMKINGAAATSGSAVTVDNLTVGDNTMAVQVTAADGTTVKTYTLTVSRAASGGGQSSADLSGLTVAGYDLDPAFAAGTTAYTVNIPNEVSSVEITATTADSGATMKINGTAATSGSAQSVGSLVVGGNQVPVEVTAADQSTVKTYALTIKRAQSASPDDNSLAALTVSSVVYEGAEPHVAACGIYPGFSSNQTEGIVDVANGVAEVRITAQTASSSATLAINGEPATSGVATVINAAGLAVGDNPIPILVTAANGSQRSYTLHVKKVSAGYQLPALPQTPQAYQESEYANYARRLATSQTHVLAVKKDGTVAAWGESSKGQCNIPVGLDEIVAVAAGSYHSLVLQADGTVAAWGQNSYGQCDVPDGLQDVADIAGGVDFSVALGQNGEVSVWGRNNYGQCDMPDGLENVVDIQCGSYYTLALQADGTVAAWGRNLNGQCDVPDGLDQVVAIAAGTHYSAALKADGSMVIWGMEGTNYEINNIGLQYIKAIAAGPHYVAAMKWDGSLAAWGNKGYERNIDLGVPLALEQNVLAVSAPGSGANFMLALNEDGTLDAWAEDIDRCSQCCIPSGLNLFADDTPYSGPSPDIPQTPAAYAASDYVRAVDRVFYIGTGVMVLNMDGTVKAVLTNDYYNLAGVAEGLSDVKAIAVAGSNNIMALQEDGTVAVWGYNGDGQCDVPAGLSNVTAIAMGNIGSSPCCLALKADGTVTAWGGNQYGECDVPTGLNNVTAIAAGGKCCLALKADGTVVAWGNNDYGQCDVPVGLNNVARIYASQFYDFCLALKNDGTVSAWGSNCNRFKQYYCGQCDVPEDLSGVVDIAVSGTTCTALKSDGTVVVWGDNTYGHRNVPVGLHDVAAVSGAALAIKTDGTVVNWGYNISNGEQLAGLSKVLTIAASNIAIFRDGTLSYCGGGANADVFNAALEGLNVLSGHYFAVKKAKLLNPAGQVITSVGSQGGYRIEAQVANNYASPTNGLTIIQVRGGNGATSSGGGRVLGCVGLSGQIPVSGSTVSSDFAMPSGISGKAYVDVFVWDGWDTMVPRAKAKQDLSFSVTQ